MPITSSAPGVAAALLLALALGCDRTEPTESGASPEAHTSAAPEPAPPDDGEGAGAGGQEKAGDAQVAPEPSPIQEVVVARSEQAPERPSRVVSLAPAITEIIHAVGAGEALVGVTRYCDYPPEVTELPKVGGFVDPDLEAILALRPDLVVGMAAGDPDIQGKLERAEIPYLFVRMDTFDQTYRGIRALGEALGHAEQAADLVGRMRRQVHKVSASAQERARGDAPEVLFVLGHKPLVVAGPETFGDELITLAGGANAAAGLEGSYPKLDLERVLAMDPDVIVDAAMVPGEGSNLDFWEKRAGLEAVESGRVHAWSEAALLRPGPRLVEALRSFVRALHPGLGELP